MCKLILQTLIFQMCYQTYETNKQAIRRFLELSTLVTIILSISGCQNYSLSVNDNEIYTPPILFSDYTIDDPSLSFCIKKTIQEQGVTIAEDLEILICAEKGIISLSGIEQFPSLKTLGISNNSVTDIADLALIKQLEKVDLSNNNIISAKPLMHFQHLMTIDLRGNNQLVCIKLPASSETLMPQHCN